MPLARRDRLDVLVAAAHRLRRAIFDNGTATSAELRAAAYAGTVNDPVLAAFVSAVRDHPSRIIDADVRELREHGMTDDAVFELTVAAALGAAQRRLDAGLAVLDSAGRS